MRLRLDLSSIQSRGFMSNWICSIKGSDVGPLTSVELKELARLGKLTPSNKVRNEDSSTWHEASKVKELFEQDVRTS